MQNSNADFDYIFDMLGNDIYTYLHPKDLFSFSFSNHQHFKKIRNNLIHVFMRQLPIQLGVGTNYLVEISKGHSFSTREDLMDHLLDKIRSAKIFLLGTSTMEESLLLAREMLSGDNGSCATFQTFNNEHLPPVTAEYHFQSDISQDSAKAWARYIIDRDCCKNRRGKAVHRYKFVLEWLHYILSQDNHILGNWRWSCKHSNLNFKGVAGVGVMISTPEIGGEMEIRLTRKY